MTLDKFIKAYAKAAGLLFASAAASYFLTYYTTLSPPLKPRDTIFGMSVLIEAFAVLAGFTWRHLKPPLWMMIGAIVLYLCSLFSLTFLIPTSDSAYREAMGLICKPDFLMLYGPACYWIEPSILAKASFEPDRIWVYPSIVLVRGTLCALWLLMVAVIVLSISISVHARQSRRSLSRSRRIH